MKKHTNIPKYPDVTETVFVEGLDKEVTLHDLSVYYQIKIADDPEFDTPINALIDAGMDEEDVMKLRRNTLNALYRRVLELTYPEVMEAIENGELDEKKEDAETSKKN